MQHPEFRFVANHATEPYYKQQLIKLIRIATFFQLVAHALTGDQHNNRNTEYFLKRLVNGRIAYKERPPREEMPKHAEYGDRVLCRLVDRLQTLWLLDEDGYQGQEFQGDNKGEEEFESENEAVTAYLNTMANFVQEDSAALLKGLPELPRKLEDSMKPLKTTRNHHQRPQKIPNSLVVRVKMGPLSTPERQSQRDEDLKEEADRQKAHSEQAEGQVDHRAVRQEVQ